MNASNILMHYLGGEGRLWRLFWLWGVVGSWILFALFFVSLQTFGINWPLFLLSAVVMVPFTVWILTSVWMCALNVNNRMWGDAARFLTFFWALNVGAVGGWMLTQLIFD